MYSSTNSTPTSATGLEVYSKIPYSSLGSGTNTSPSTKMESFGQSFWNGYVSSTHSSDEAESLVLGIDFGSSNSSVAVWRADKNKVKIIRNSSLPGDVIYSAVFDCLSFTFIFLLYSASKTTPSLIQFNQTFNGYKVGNECDASMDHVISNLKSLLLHPEAEIAAVLDDHVSSHSAWVDGTTLKCFDRPAVHTKGEAEKRPGKTVPVEVLVGFLLSYLKECAEMYLTRRPIKQVNVIDGSQVETTTNYTAPPASTTSSVKTKKEDTPGSALHVEVTRVVLGVPVNCTERSKQSLKKAAHLAGFTDVRHFLPYIIQFSNVSFHFLNKLRLDIFSSITLATGAFSR